MFFDDSRDPWQVRPLVERHEGLGGVILHASDCDVVRRQLVAAGLPVSAVLPLQRDVDTPEGVRTARFRTVHIGREVTPEGEVLIGQHLTPELVQHRVNHRNSATGLVSMLLVTSDDDIDAHVRRWSRIVGRPHRDDGPRRVFNLGTASIELIPDAALPDVLPGESAPLLPMFAAQTVTVADVTGARRLIDGAGLPTHDLPAGNHPRTGFFVPAVAAAGAALVCVAG